MGCLFPKKMYVNTRKQFYTVPCNNCYMCRMAKASKISTLLKSESKRLLWLGHSTSFVTLTLNDPLLNLTHLKTTYINKKKNFVYSLNKKFAQNFYHNLYMKLQRSGFNDFKLYFVGEYGDQFSRPHYHMLVLGVSPDELAPILYNTWRFGKIDCQTAGLKSFDYCVKYILKRQNKKLKKLYETYGLEPPFSFKSKSIADKFILDNRTMIQKLGGIPIGEKIIPLGSYLSKKYGVLSDVRGKCNEKAIQKMVRYLHTTHNLNLTAKDDILIMQHIALIQYNAAMTRNKLHGIPIEDISLPKTLKIWSSNGLNNKILASMALGD